MEKKTSSKQASKYLSRRRVHADQPSAPETTCVVVFTPCSSLLHAYSRRTLTTSRTPRSIGRSRSHSAWRAVDRLRDHLSELTLIQDLRALIGTLPGADRREWFDQYGRIGGPLNAKGLLVSVDGRPLVLRSGGFDLSVEDHVRYTFHFETDLPPRGRLAIRDTNYASGEGMSRLAVRGVGGVVIRGDDLPSDVTKIPHRPVWQLTDAEERRTRQLEVEFEPGGGMTGEAPARRRQSRRGGRLDRACRPRGCRDSWTARRFRDWDCG